MSKLVISDLKTTLTQRIRLSLATRYTIGGIYPWIYVHNMPAGTFTLEVISGGTTVASDSFTALEIKQASGSTGNYLMSWHPVLFSAPLQLDAGLFDVRLSATGYTFSDSSFLSWVQPHENLPAGLEYVPMDDSVNPLGLRIKVLRKYE